MTMYSFLTMFYLMIIAATTFVGFQNRKQKGYSLFGMKFDKMVALSIFSTMLFSFMTAYSMENMGFLWSNLTFVMSAVGVTVFTYLVLAGANMIQSDAKRAENIQQQIDSIDQKKAGLDTRISEMKKYISSLATPEDRQEAKPMLDELVSLRKQYKDIRQELVIQKSMLEARQEGSELEKMRLVSQADTMRGMKGHTRRLKMNRALDDNLSGVQSIIKKY